MEKEYWSRVSVPELAVTFLRSRVREILKELV